MSYQPSEDDKLVAHEIVTGAERMSEERIALHLAMNRSDTINRCYQVCVMMAEKFSTDRERSVDAVNAAHDCADQIMKRVK